MSTDPTTQTTKGDFAFEVHYIRQMPGDVPVWVEKALIVGSWWLRQFARDVVAAVIFTALCWALGSLQQLSYGEPTISLFHPAILNAAIILALCVHTVTCGFGKSALQHRVVLLPPGTNGPPRLRYRLLNASCIIGSIAILAMAAWMTRPAAREAWREHFAKCQLAADLLQEMPSECRPLDPPGPPRQWTS